MSNIEMTKKGNLRVNGKKYKAVPSMRLDGVPLGCTGCVLISSGYDCSDVACTATRRHKAGFSAIEVIFVSEQGTVNYA